ncbi:uncharacterized protein LOC143535585 [Bidens hawaiensis]|uniref:uncharacterized protein LOC143535585 n=1 Tax=Bidens hawaiensis TaxID=980011 RepID=UPI00404B468F
MRLANDLPEHFEYFQQRDDARGKPGFTATQKITAALRQLAYGVGSDMLDEYLQMAKKTGRDALNHFCRGAISLYRRRYLRRPTMYDIQRIYEVHGEKHEPPQAFFANGEHFKYEYYLVDGIYNEWGILVQAYVAPVYDKRKYFTKKQESARKDIERVFGVLKKRWAMLANPIRFWTREKITEVVIMCISLHNMILEDEGKAICQNYKGDIPRQESTITNEQRLANINIIKSELHGNLNQKGCPCARSSHAITIVGDKAYAFVLDGYK